MRSRRASKTCWVGIFSLVLAGVFFWLLGNHSPEDGGFLPIQAILWIIYSLGGKWLALAVFGLLGLYLVIVGILNLFGVEYRRR